MVGLVFDAALLREDAAEAATVRAYAPEVADALTRRAPFRWAAVASNLAGGALSVAGAAYYWRCAGAPATSAPALFFLANALFLIGLLLFDAGLAILVWDVRATSLQVAAANGATPPGWAFCGGGALLSLVGILAALLCITAGDAALLSPQRFAARDAVALFQLVRSATRVRAVCACASSVVACAR